MPACPWPCCPCHQKPCGPFSLPQPPMLSSRFAGLIYGENALGVLNDRLLNYNWSLPALPHDLRWRLILWVSPGNRGGGGGSEQPSMDCVSC